MPGRSWLLALASPLRVAPAAAGSAVGRPRPEAATALRRWRRSPTTPEEFLRRPAGHLRGGGPGREPAAPHGRATTRSGRRPWARAPGSGCAATTGTSGTSPPRRASSRSSTRRRCPIWVLPDWYFVEKGLPIPPEDAPERAGCRTSWASRRSTWARRSPSTAPSARSCWGSGCRHGCIRLENNVRPAPLPQRAGGHAGGDRRRRGPRRPAAGARRAIPGKPKPAQAADPLAGVSTAQLLAPPGAPTWRTRDTSTGLGGLASRLITRGLKDDADALRGLLALRGHRGHGEAEPRVRHLPGRRLLARLAAGGGLAGAHRRRRARRGRRRRSSRRRWRSHPGGRLDGRGAALAHAARVPGARWGPTGREGWEALARRGGGATARRRRRGGRGTRSAHERGASGCWDAQDLHVHTTMSDGDLSLEEVVGAGARSGG